MYISVATVHRLDPLNAYNSTIGSFLFNPTSTANDSCRSLLSCSQVDPNLGFTVKRTLELSTRGNSTYNSVWIYMYYIASFEHEFA